MIARTILPMVSPPIASSESTPIPDSIPVITLNQLLLSRRKKACVVASMTAGSSNASE